MPPQAGSAPSRARGGSINSHRITGNLADSHPHGLTTGVRTIGEVAHAALSLLEADPPLGPEEGFNCIPDYSRS
jgi:hypothetical protein